MVNSEWSMVNNKPKTSGFLFFLPQGAQGFEKKLYAL